jgi:hypothetical protein
MIVPAAAAASSGAAAAGISLTAAQASYVPAQFIAKLYTEGLGRIPDQSGWASAVSYFAQNGCSAPSLAAYGQSVYTSAEYTGLQYDNDAKLLTLYRGVLNREPDPSGFANWLQHLGSGTSWPSAVQLFFTRAARPITSGPSRRSRCLPPAVGSPARRRPCSKR